MIQINPNRVRYLLTPAGIAQKTRMSRAYLESSIKFYVEARDRITERLSVLSAEWPSDAGNHSGEKRIVFYGTGEVAEIGYICLQVTDLRLIGVIDNTRRARFFNIPVYSALDLRGRELRGATFDQLVVTAFDQPESTKIALEAANVPPERVVWL